MMVTNYLTLVFTEGSLTGWTEDGQSPLLVPSRIQPATAGCILVFWHYTTWTRDRTYMLFPSDSIFYQLVLCGFTRSTYWA